MHYKTTKYFVFIALRCMHFLQKFITYIVAAKYRKPFFKHHAFDNPCFLGTALTTP